MYDGVLLLHKPQGFTSHDAVAKARGIFAQRRIGHAGTLDPMAEGLLVVLLGGATRASDYAAGQDKEYIARLRLGLVTDTQDVTGTALTEQSADVPEEALRAALARFTGTVAQVPPMYSAVQVGGQRLYKLARKGVEVERQAREIHISALELLPRADGLRPDEWDLRVVCSKGTYVRTLCHDLGAALGCGGCMAALTRTRCGRFSLADACTFEELEGRRDDLSPFLRPTEEVFSDLPAVTVNESGAVRARNGAFLTEGELSSGEAPPEGCLCRVFDGGRLLWLGESRALDRGGVAVFCKVSFFTA